MNINQSRESLVFDYRTLRLIIGVLAFAFPAMVGALTGKITASISASYYEEGSRDVFVGFMFILGALLVSYRGHPLDVTSSRGGRLWVRIQRYQEDWVSGIGGIAAILTALYPTACDKCTLDTAARIHTIGAFILFSNLIYFSLIAFLRSLNKKLEIKEELAGIHKVTVPENGSLVRKVVNFLFCEIFYFRSIVSQLSRKYDEKQAQHIDKLSFSYRRAKMKYLLDVYGQKIRRGFVYVTCGSLIFLTFLVYIPTALLVPNLVTYLKLTFVVETISLVLFGFAWTTAGHLPYFRKIRLWLVLRQKKQALVPQLGKA